MQIIVGKKVDPHAQTALLPLFLVSILAFFIPILTSWFSKKYKIPIPTVVGEIIFGILIGKSFLGLIDSTETIPWLDFLSLFGFTYLMFLSGLEVDMSTIASNKNVNSFYETDNNKYKSPIFLGIAHFILTLVLSSVIAYLLYINNIVSSWVMMMLILSTTSVSIVVPVLKEKSLSKTLLGQTILFSALVADFLTMVLITIFIAFKVSGTPSFTILLFTLLIGLIVIIYRLHVSKVFDALISKLFVVKPILNELAHSTAQIKVRGAIALMIVFIVASQIMGFEIILGAFIAGILTTLILGEEKTDQLEMKLDAIGYGFFIPIFFLSIGINLDLRVFFESKTAWILLGFLIFSAFLIKIIPSLIFTLRFKLQDAFGAGVLLSSRLSLIIAASTIGLKEGLISEEVNASIVMVAVISCILSPILFNRFTETTKKPLKESVTIIGANIHARILAEKLADHINSVKLIAMNNEEYEAAKKRGLNVIKQIHSIKKAIMSSGINNSRVLVLATDDDKLNLRIASFVQKNYSVPNIVALVNQQNHRDRFKELNVQTVTKVTTVVDKLLSKTMFPLSDYHATIGENEINLVDVLITNPDFNNKMLKDIKLPGDTVIVHVIREEESLAPQEETIVYLCDHLTLIGSYDSLQASINILNPEN